MKASTTTIRVDGATLWEVPYGFGTSYREILAHHRELGPKSRVPAAVSDALALIGYSAPSDVVAKWAQRKQVEAHVYAWLEHLAASDNPVHRHPKPEWLPEPWAGPLRHGPDCAITAFEQDGRPGLITPDCTCIGGDGGPTEVRS